MTDMRKTLLKKVACDRHAQNTIEEGGKGFHSAPCRVCVCGGGGGSGVGTETG